MYKKEIEYNQGPVYVDWFNTQNQLEPPILGGVFYTV